MFDKYVNINTYQCRIKALKQQVDDLRSGNAMKKLQKEYERLLDEREKTIRALETQLAQAHAQIVHVRELWMQVLDDMEKEHQKQVDALMREIKRLKQRVLDVERQRDEVKDKLREKIKEYYAAATECHPTDYLNPPCADYLKPILMPNKLLLTIRDTYSANY